MALLCRLDIQADESTVLPVQMRDIGLRKIIDVPVTRLPPVVMAHIAKSCRGEDRPQSLKVIGRPVVDRALSFLREDDDPAVEGTVDQREVQTPPVDLGQRRKIRDGHAQHPTRLQHATPLMEDWLHFDAVEILEDVTGIDELSDPILDHRETPDIVAVVNMGKICQIYMDEPGQKPLAAAQMQFHEALRLPSPRKKVWISAQIRLIVSSSRKEAEGSHRPCREMCSVSGKHSCRWYGPWVWIAG